MTSYSSFNTGNRTLQKPVYYPYPPAYETDFNRTIELVADRHGSSAEAC